MQKFIVLLLSLSLIACSSTSSTSNDTETASTAVDITNSILTNRASNCAEYVNQYTSSVNDIQRSVVFAGNLVISFNASKCSFQTNAIPNHDFNDASASFATQVSEQSLTFEVTSSPVAATSTSSLSLQSDNAIFLNGVKLDLLAAACFNVGDGKIGCFDISTPWRFDPMSPLNDFGTDTHNAHTQPDGTYHYHGNPAALFAVSTTNASPVIGFAADGYPIYGSYVSDNGTVRKVLSSYQLKSNGGSRVAASDGSDPGGNYDGTYIDDYEYSVGLGDLDECNGMTVDGNYGYYVTDTYPWVLACFKGTPDSSFNK